ncbi:Type II secretion system (T2SS), protein F [uncultured archaeon]|nr:Type II secretion system (T2SS), protein F [uncultured archaeon]
MPSIFENRTIAEMSRPLRGSAKHLEALFPTIEWDLKRAGYAIDPTQYFSIVIYLALTSTIGTFIVVAVPTTLSKGISQVYSSILFAAVIGALAFFYLLVIPKNRIAKRARLIDSDLEYMLKDIQIQLTSGVPLFDTMVNVARGQYGECSAIAAGIVQEVESGRSMTDVLDDVGLWSPSDYLRKVLWQIVSAVKSGGDVLDALESIANDIRADKEAKIEKYGKELNLYSLVYMMAAIILPSMGVTLLVILSTFIQKGTITPVLFWYIFGFLILFQMVFISFIRNKRPQI